MKVPGGQLRTVLGRHLRTQRTSLSMMPEGLEAALTHRKWPIHRVYKKVG